MLLARRLLDNFIDQLPENFKVDIYQLAAREVDLAMAQMALAYEEIYGDYPTGFIATMILQHLKDKAFQLNHQQKKRVA